MSGAGPQNDWWDVGDLLYAAVWKQWRQHRPRWPLAWLQLWLTGSNGEVFWDGCCAINGCFNHHCVRQCWPDGGRLMCSLDCLLQNCSGAVVVATLQQAIDALLSATWKFCCKAFAETHYDDRSRAQVVTSRQIAKRAEAFRDKVCPYMFARRFQLRCDKIVLPVFAKRDIHC